LGLAPVGTERRLVAFLETIRCKADSLFILGDLFDFWFEYGRTIPRYGSRVLAEIYRLKEFGVRIVYLSGNHDFRFQGFFRSEVGIRTGHIVEETIDEQRIWMSHGDELDQRLVSVLFRRLMRSRAGEIAHSMVPSGLRAELAVWAATISRARGQDEYLCQEMVRFAAGKLGKGFDIVVMGHVHLPVLQEFENGVYLNTGDWLTHFSYGVIRNGAVSLEYFRG